MQVISRKQARKEKLVKYFTGKPCKNGHVDLRWACNGRCISCHYEKNPLSKKKKKTEKEKREETRARAKLWYEANKQKTIDRAKEWKAKNRESVRASEARWRKKKKSKAITFMRDSLRRVLKVEKKGRTEEILGYNRHQLVRHIESQFSRGMSWDNYGDWHIDHITPVSLMLDSGITCPREINCLSNLMPVWAKENLKKNANRKFLI